MPTPSLLIVPARFKSGKLYSQIPTSGAGDFTVTRATAATRVNASGLIESVASGIPRLDYFATGGTVGCPALLVEPSAQNLVQRSEEFNNAFHFRNNLNAFGSGSVANTTATLDPYGTNVADYIQENSAASTQHSIIDIFAGNVSGTTFTWSIFAKAAERTIIQLANNAGGGGNANFNLITGIATLNTGVSASMQNYGNGWWRCTLTYTSSITGNHNVQVRLCDASGNTTYNGTGNQGAYIFGAQLETGSVSTSYIPTTTGSVTRNADVVSVSGAVSGSIGQTEGSIYAEVNIQKLLGATQRAIVDIGQSGNRLFLGYGNGLTNQIRFLLQTSLGGLVDINSSATSTGTIKIAVGYKNNDSIMYVNGVSGTVLSNDTFTSSLNALTGLSIGSSNVVGETHFLNDRIRAAALYTTRLTNAELAALTTP